jgi:hypothetical protein
VHCTRYINLAIGLGSISSGNFIKFKIVANLRHMLKFKAEILKYGANGDKTAWTYVQIPSGLAEKLSPGSRKSFRVKGMLDNIQVEALALVPVGGGDFILPLKKEIRKALKKDKGATIVLAIEKDENPDPFPMPQDFAECLADEPDAVKTFNGITKSHQHYFIKWIDSAKTDATRIKRIAIAVNALCQGMQYGEMIRAEKKKQEPY